MMNRLTRKLEGFVYLSDEERYTIDQLQEEVILRRAGTDRIKEGDRPADVHILLEGWAFRYKLLPDGCRQIMAYLIPGDLCDIHVFILKRMDHSIGLLSDSRVALRSEAAMIEFTDRHPRISRALFWATLVDEATLREWLANSLRRKPFERLAHLFCEMWLRMHAVGLIEEGNAFDLPLTQAELADTIGLTAVTVNRVLQRLRAEKLITLRGAQLTILDINRLRVVSGFNPNYLHLNDEERGDRTLFKGAVTQAGASRYGRRP